MGHLLPGWCKAHNMIRSIAHDQPQKNFKHVWLVFLASIGCVCASAVSSDALASLAVRVVLRRLPWHPGSAPCPRPDTDEGWRGSPATGARLYDTGRGLDRRFAVLHRG